mgnify:CR=1 FL=1
MRLCCCDICERAHLESIDIVSQGAGLRVEIQKREEDDELKWIDNFPTEYDCLMYGGNWDSGDDIGEQCDGLDSTNCLMLDGQWVEAGLIEAGTWTYENGGFFLDPNEISGAPDQFAGADLVMDEDGNWLSLDLRFHIQLIYLVMLCLN